MIAIDGYRVLRAAAWVCVAVSLGCASDPITTQGPRYRHRTLGYEIGFPSSQFAEWERFEVKGADLAFRTRSQDSGPAETSTMSLQSACRKTAADPSMLARHLRIGLDQPKLLSSGPVEVDGRDAWQQVFDTREQDHSVRVKTVTVLAGGCTFDWILIARGDFEPLERSFDAWWASFHSNAGLSSSQQAPS